MTTLTRQLRVKWNIALKKETFIAPILIHKEIVYVKVKKDNGKGTLWAINAEDGKVKWKFGEFKKLTTFETQTDVIDDALVILNEDNFYIVDRQRGKELKKLKLGNREYRSFPPVLNDGLLYFSGEENHCLSAVDIKTKTLKWQLPVKGKGIETDYTISHKVWEGRITSSPILVNGTVCVAVLAKESGFSELASNSARDLIYCVDIKTGRKKWQFADESNNELPQYIGASKDRIYFIGSLNSSLIALDSETGSKKGEFFLNKILVNPTHEPAIAENMLYITSGESQNIYALNANTCKKLWQKSSDCFWLKPVSYASTVYFTIESKRCLMAVDSRTGRQKWTFTAKYPKKSELSPWFGHMPAFTNNLICFCCGENSVYALDALTGNETGAFFANNVKLDYPAASEASIYCFASNDSPNWTHLYALSTI